MERTHGSKGLALVECINPYMDKYRIRWDMRTETQTATEGGEERTHEDVSFYETECLGKPTASYIVGSLQGSGCEVSLTEAKEIFDAFELDGLEGMKTLLLGNIALYDASSSVNSFSLNGASVWLDKATRVGLMNSTTIAKSMGSETTTLWLGEVKLEVECDKAIQLLSALEMYALECFNVTAAHKKAVSALESIEDVLAYDYTANYPSKLEMTV